MLAKAAVLPTLGETVADVQIPHSVGYPVFLHYWMRIGTAEEMVRFPSAVAGCPVNLSPFSARQACELCASWPCCRPASRSCGPSDSFLARGRRLQHSERCPHRSRPGLDTSASEQSVVFLDRVFSFGNSLPLPTPSGLHHNGGLVFTGTSCLGVWIRCEKLHGCSWVKAR